ncbi:hypothetical protein DFH06DRAFT_1135505 [Mycena polygramma]|nr:hypothetical protein DFH06DRAFT_1135505 [Mycena polygramma]
MPTRGKLIGMHLQFYSKSWSQNLAGKPASNSCPRILLLLALELRRTFRPADLEKSGIFLYFLSRDIGNPKGLVKKSAALRDARSAHAASGTELNTTQLPYGLGKDWDKIYFGPGWDARRGGTRSSRPLMATSVWEVNLSAMAGDHWRAWNKMKGRTQERQWSRKPWKSLNIEYYMHDVKQYGSTLISSISQAFDIPFPCGSAPREVPTLAGYFDASPMASHPTGPSKLPSQTILSPRRQRPSVRLTLTVIRRILEILGIILRRVRRGAAATLKLWHWISTLDTLAALRSHWRVLLLEWIARLDVFLRSSLILDESGVHGKSEFLPVVRTTYKFALVLSLPSVTDSVGHPMVFIGRLSASPAVRACSLGWQPQVDDQSHLASRLIKLNFVPVTSAGK